MATETQRNCLLEPYIARVNAKTNFPFECEWLNNQKIKLRSVVYPGEGSGNPLQYPCLENPWTEEPGRLQSMGLQRVGHDLATNHHHHHLSQSPLSYDAGVTVSFVDI